MFILGVGSATAQYKLSTNRLKELGAVVDPQAPSSRSTIIGESLFTTPKERLLSASETPTTLGKQAVENACAAAGITLDQIGLLVGDCATPIQTTPSEGQQIAGTLGLKIPAFDITAAAVGNILHVDTVRRWKKEKVPAISVFVSSNAPTHAVDFKDASSSFFADGASAVVVAKEHLGKKAFRIVDSEVYFDNAHLSSSSIAKLAGATFTKDYLQHSILGHTKKILETIKNRKPDVFEKSFLLLGPTAIDATSGLAKELGFKADAILSVGKSEGDMIGASPFHCLSVFASQIPVGSTVFLVGTGIGTGYGFLQLHLEDA